ncbi:MAG: alkaline phosphatase family protein [Culturomica sp.]|jgi:hypothetical protein|nr:alkaline phosphatase family protein [Culturomica sp.]
MRGVSFLFLIILIFVNSILHSEEKPKLVVGVTISFFYPEWLQMYEHLLSQNGLRRFMSDRQYELGYDYFYSQTGVDQTTIYTGALPNVHGIVGHDWYDRLKRRRINNVYSSIYKEIGEGNTLQGASTENQNMLTLGCRMKMQDSFSKVYSIGANEEESVLSGGSCANLALWFNEQSGKWVSSTFYADSLPKWVTDFNSLNESDYYLRRGWMPVEQENSNTTMVKIRSKIGMNEDFYYDLSQTKRRFNNYIALKATPYINSMITALAMNLVKEEQLGKDNDSDFLMLNFNALDYMNRDFSISDNEFKDFVIRLDRDVEKFFTLLDEKVGKGHYVAFLTFVEARELLPTELSKMRVPAGEFSIYKSVALLKSYLNLLYGEGDWVTDYDAVQIYLNRELINKKGLKLKDFQDVVADFIIDFEGVAKTLTSYSLTHGTYASGNEYLVQNSFYHKKNGDVLYYLLPCWVPEIKEREDLYFRYSKRHKLPFYVYGDNNNLSKNYLHTSMCDVMTWLSVLLNLPK